MDTVIDRDLRAAVAQTYDLLVIGGGIYGAALALEAAGRGLSVLVLERGEFGAETTASSLRIVHGGLRYLQTLDLARHQESVGERRWFLNQFPDLVAPLPCLMPLYDPPRGGWLRRPGVFRMALAMDSLLSTGQNAGLPRGRFLGIDETAGLFPMVDRDGLRGAVLWHDAIVLDPHRLISEILLRACRAGARAFNHAEVAELRVEGGRVQGLRTVDRLSGQSFEVRADAVANCAGPWVRSLARQFDRDIPALFHPVLAFNLLLDLEPLASGTVAVTSRQPGAQTWFLVPWRGKVLAGTAYAPATGESGPPGEPMVADFLRELNEAAPGLSLGREHVRQVLWGRLPARAEGSTTPASRPVIYDHGRHGGPRGLVSVSGVKLTTARAVAERVLRTLDLGERRAAA
jgi:glycerol-3-phosphate dehydrogenase